MRFSIAAVVCGAAAASAAAVAPEPFKAPQFSRRDGVPAFHMVPLEQAHSTVQTHNANAPPLPPSSSFSTNAASAKCSNLQVRTEWRLLSNSQKASFVNAVKCLMGKPSAGGYPGSRNRYEDLVSVHQQMVNTIHMVGQFLPWHRYYLHIFQGLLKSQCGYNSPLPWWDETQDAGHFHSSPIFDANFFGTGPQATSSGAATCMVNTGVCFCDPYFVLPVRCRR